MDIIKTDVAIIGAGGGGLRAAIAIAEAHPELEIALISKVYLMRSHTVAAEGGAAGVVRDDDSLENHFNDTVSGGDWLCEQDVVDYFVNNATNEMIQLEHWGCPWSRKPDGKANVRRFGGMKIPAPGSRRTNPASTFCTPCSRPPSSTRPSSALTSTSAWISSWKMAASRAY